MDGSSTEVVSGFLRSTQDEMQAAGDISAYRRPFRTEGYVDIHSIKVCGYEPGAACIGSGTTCI